MWKDPLQKAEIGLKEAEKDFTDQKKTESEWETNYKKWQIEKADWETKVLRSIERLNTVQAKNLEKEYPRKEFMGEAFSTAKDVKDYGADLLHKASKIEPLHVIKGMWESGKDLFKDAKDWLNSFGPHKQTAPGDTYGTGRGNTPGGQHKAGQKIPWSEVEKQRGKEHSPNWDNVPLVPSENYRGGKR